MEHKVDKVTDTAPTHLTDDDLNKVAGGVAGGNPDTTDPGDVLSAEILHVVGEDPHDLHADPGPGSVDQSNTVDQRSDKIHRR